MSDLYSLNDQSTNAGIYRPTSLYSIANPRPPIDLRANLHEILFGYRGHPPQGRPVILRHMTSICPCMLEEEGQKQKDASPKCSICQGEGFLFTEAIYTAWRSTIDEATSVLGLYSQKMPGLSIDAGFAFFFEYNVPVFNLDKIYELALDSNGNMPAINPAVGPIIADMTVRRKKYKISNLVDYRADNARIEFWMAPGIIEAW